MGNLSDLNFNAANEQTMDDRSPIPVGKYPMVISGSEIKVTQKGDNMASLTLDVIDGEHKGRKVWANLNLWNSNPAAVEMAKKELASICKAIGIQSPDDTEKLHNIPMLVSIGIKADRNEIRSYEPMPGYTQPNIQFAPTQQQQQQPQQQYQQPAPQQQYAPAQPNQQQAQQPMQQPPTNNNWMGNQG